MKTHAVLTGDLVRSRTLPEGRRKKVIAFLKGLSKEFGKLHVGANVGEVDIFRGDSWQFCLKKPELAVTSAIFFRTGLKTEGLDSRIGIGIGSVESLNPKKISESTGPAFVASGHSLDSLVGERYLGLAFSNDWDEASTRQLPSGPSHGRTTAVSPPARLFRTRSLEANGEV